MNGSFGIFGLTMMIHGIFRLTIIIHSISRKTLMLSLRDTAQSTSLVSATPSVLGPLCSVSNTSC